MKQVQCGYMRDAFGIAFRILVFSFPPPPFNLLPPSYASEMPQKFPVNRQLYLVRGWVIKYHQG